MKPFLRLVGPLAMILLGSLCLPATASAQAATILACKNDTNGNLRYVTDAGECRQPETAINLTSGAPAGVNGQGTPGTVPLWTGSGTTLTDSNIQDSGGQVIITVPVSASAPGTGGGPTIEAWSTNGVGVAGISPNGIGVIGSTMGTGGSGVTGFGAANGVMGFATSSGGWGTRGFAAGNGVGVEGTSVGGVGIRGSLLSCDDNHNCTPTAGDAGQFVTGAGGILLHGFLSNFNAPGGWDEKFVVDAAGNMTIHGNAFKPGGGSWSTLSDARTKKSIEPIGSPLAQLLKLRGVTFEYANPAAVHERPGVHIGMVAQDVEQVFPSWVDAGSDGYKRLTFRGFEAVAVEAVRELDAKSDQVSARIAELERQNAELWRALDVLSQAVRTVKDK
jgi:hypothetical protein